MTIYLVFLLNLIISSLAFAEQTVLCSTYESCREDFIQAGLGWGHKSWPVTAKPGLTTDVLHKTPAHPTAIVVSSGLHGIEGFVGSVIQQKWLNQIKNKQCAKDFIFIHSLNPWGMKNLRRTDENNVDLNRNFANSEELYKTKNPEYQKISHFLNPRTNYQIYFAEKPLFILQSLGLILQHSIDTLRKSILKGQYEEPQGIYFGGHRPSEQKQKLIEFKDQYLKSYKSIFWIDLHTGYGARGQLHLLANTQDEEKKKKLQAWFPKVGIDFGDQKNFYNTTGDLISFIETWSTAESTYQGLVFEYGTLDSQKTLGSIESLRRMIRENQKSQYKAVDEKSDEKVMAEFKDMFAPEDPEWNRKISQQTETLIAELCP